MILYPTETLYALGVNALDEVELQKLYELKGRDSAKVASWIVRDVADMERFAELSETARAIAEQFLPGPLTLVLPAKDTVPARRAAPDKTIGLRISSDPMAQTIIDAFMAEYDAPLTCTSANVSGQPSLPTVPEILQQFGEKATMIDEIHDDGPRKGLASTVVKVVGEEVSVIREGAITEEVIRKALR